MGLSDEERYNNIIEIINEFKSMDPFTDYYLKVFNKPIKDLWFSLLGKTHNGAHWVVGSASTDNTIHGMSIFGALMLQAKSNIDWKKKPEVDLDPDVIKFFNYKDMYSPNAVKLLQTGHVSEQSNVFKIFRLTESYFYYANRYDDEFSAKFSNLTKDICELQGLCYNAFKSDEVYLKAWLIESIFTKLLTYDEKDIVNKWFMENSIHHDIKIKNLSARELFYILKEVQFKNNLTVERRLTIILAMTGIGFNYSHQHKELLSLINKHNLSSEVKINSELIEKICQGIIKLKEKVDKERMTSYNEYCYLTEQSKDHND